MVMGWVVVGGSMGSAIAGLFSWQRMKWVILVTLRI